MKIRSVRPEFFTDSKMSLLSHSARLLYIGLWCLADDEGRGRLLPKHIEGEVFPYEHVDFNSLWMELERSKRVRSYMVDGEAFWVIPTFEEYQKPNRKYESKLPAPPDDSELVLFEHGVSTAPAYATPRARTAHAHAGVVVGEGEGEGAAAGVSRAAQSDFEVFHRRRVAGLPQVAAANNPNAMAFKLVNADDVREESERIWAHRSCRTCQGKGFTEVYSPGAGMVKSNCTEETDE